MRFESKYENMIKDHKVKRYFKNPKIPILLHEKVEPVGHIFNAIVLFSSSLLIQKTSQRALLLDGAKSDAVLVVNTSLFSDDVIKLVKKYNLSQNWFGKVVTIKTSKIDKSPSYPLLGSEPEETIMQAAE
ncbi:MAG: hypothetical protein QXY47_00685 [Thermoplasmata archaeon]